jgi:2-polyprenyl-6-methoxyphenol hydroxylase-like FAD-dependent oxidoreductase
MAETRHVPVVIVGGGPVGLVLAIDLAQRGVATALLESSDAPRSFPKGNTHNARTMEHYRRLGLADRIRQVGLPADYPTDVGYFTSLNGFELARIRMPSSSAKLAQAREAGPLDQVPEPIHRANQMYVEAILFERARTLDRVDLLYGYRCAGLSSSVDGVRVQAEHVETGRPLELRCDYLAGCDGGQSLVRRTLGLRYEGEGTLDQPFFGGPMVSTYLRIPALYERVTAAPCWQYWIVNAECRTLLYSLNGTDEFLLQTRPGTDDGERLDETVPRLVTRSAGCEVDVETLGHGMWTAGQALVAESFGDRRVFLCGDAAHLFTPTGGFGMNTGIDDAANLAWKLAAAVHGWGGPELLPSYESERKPVAIRNTTAAHRLARNVGEVPVSQTMEDDTDAGAAARAEASAFLSTFGEEFASIGIQLGARYDGSPVIAPDGTSPPADDPAVYVPSACPGGRAPHFRFADGQSLLDRLDAGFTLLCFGEVTDGARRLETRARERGVPLAPLPAGLPGARELYERDYALVRPDQHIAWRGNRVPDDVDALLDHVTGDGMAD